MFYRKGLQKIIWFVTSLFVISQFLATPILSQENNEDFTVYGVYNYVSLGNPSEAGKRDFYLTLGSKNGIKIGSSVQVYRRVATHDLLSRKLQKDMLFPIAVLKIIHAEQNGAVARLEKMLPEDTTPVINPRYVMVGDVVRPLK